MKDKTRSKLKREKDSLDVKRLVEKFLELKRFLRENF